MATIIIKNSATTGNMPSNLTQGELAINVKDGKLFYGSGSGNIVKEFTGSGGASISASYALTASFAANGGVTQLLAGPNISISPTTGVGQVTISSTGGGSSFNTATGSYGSFYDTTIQTNVASTARSMSLNTTDISNGVSISGSTNPFNTYIKVENAGVYDIQFSAQIDKTDSGTDEIWIWLRKNGSDVSDSATSIQLVGNGAHYVAAWNFFVNAAANDYFQLMWYSPDANVRLHAEAGFGVVPGIPSLIVTANRVDQFLSNTGSFSGSFNGSFTGSLFGTASWATNALTASFITTASTNAFVQNGNSFGATALLGTNDNQSLAFETSGSTRMFISSSGNVGIGTTIPGVKLDVSGDIRASGTVFNTTTQTTIIQLNSGVSVLRFFSGSVETARYDGNNWGFYTTTPTARLQVKGSGATSATTALRVENTNASASLVVRDNGSVGIGTATPSVPLEVVGNMIVSGSQTIRNSFGTTYYDSSGNGGGRIHGSYNYLNGEVYITPLGSLFQNFVFSPNNGMSIGGFTIGGTTGSPPAYGLAVSGSIGIGTRVPTAKLDVIGSARITNGLTVTGSSTITGSLTITGSFDVGVPGTNSPRITSVGTLNRGDIVSVDWMNKQLIDSALVTSVEWENRLLYDAAGSASADWNGRLLVTPGTGESALDYSNDLFTTSNIYNQQNTRNSVEGESLSNTLLNYSGQSIRASITGSAVDGNIIYLDTDGTWKTVNQTTVTSTKMLGIKLGGTTVLLEGDVVLEAGTMIKTPAYGAPLYIWEGGTVLSSDIPTSGYVRVLGHCYYQNTATTDNWIVKFRPSNDWYEI